MAEKSRSSCATRNGSNQKKFDLRSTGDFATNARVPSPSDGKSQRGSPGVPRKMTEILKACDTETQNAMCHEGRYASPVSLLPSTNFRLYLKYEGFPPTRQGGIEED
ncbi:hypothetical protein RUM43_005102 [Polyplax serrata]|uniref:Uncharacterized protein n=1 Tax=Polyplax serrata TaxID=468196 RepID=A0AAN8SBQ0_POLSC